MCIKKEEKISILVIIEQGSTNQYVGRWKEQVIEPYLRFEAENININLCLTNERKLHSTLPILLVAKMCNFSMDCFSILLRNLFSLYIR